MKIDEIKKHIRNLGADDLQDLGSFCLDLQEDKIDDFDNDPEVEAIRQEISRISKETKCKIPIEVETWWQLYIHKEFYSNMIFANLDKGALDELFLEKFPWFQDAIANLSDRISALGNKYGLDSYTAETRIISTI